MITDPIANALNHIKLGFMSKKKSVVVSSSKVIVAILQIMKDEGYIVDFITKTNESNISTTTIYLKYKNGISAIYGIKRVSKPSFRKITKAKDIPIIMSGMGTVVMSTSKGIISDKVARKLNVGGEMFAFIW